VAGTKTELHTDLETVQLHTDLETVQLHTDLETVQLHTDLALTCHVGCAGVSVLLRQSSERLAHKRVARRGDPDRLSVSCSLCLSKTSYFGFILTTRSSASFIWHNDEHLKSSMLVLVVEVLLHALLPDEAMWT
jgi:hypothetical protein